MPNTYNTTHWYQTILQVVGGYADVPINGDHNDPATRKAMRDFQKKNVLNNTGYLETDSNLALTQLALEWILGKDIPIELGKRGDIEDYIKTFQKANDISTTGNMGPQTQNAVIQELLNRTTRSTVEWYQAVLQIASGNTDVPINGDQKDAETIKALKRFQENEGLDVTGVADSETIHSLGNKGASFLIINSTPLLGDTGERGLTSLLPLLLFQIAYNLPQSGNIDTTTQLKMKETLLDLSLKKIDVFFEKLPEEQSFTACLEEKLEQVNLPAIYRTIKTNNDEYAKPIYVKNIYDFSRINIYGHFNGIKGSLKKNEHDPHWIRELRIVVAQSGTPLIDRELALVIALRESGSTNYKMTDSEEKIDTFTNGGMDNLFIAKDDLARLNLVPNSWIKKPEMEKVPDHESRAKVPQKRLLPFYFAMVGRAKHLLIKKIAEEFIEDIEEENQIISLERKIALATATFNSLPSLSQKIWISITFAAQGGSTEISTKTPSPGASGVKTFLKAFRDAKLPLDSIRDIPTAVGLNKDVEPLIIPVTQDEKNAVSFLKRAVTFFRLTIATKTALCAEVISTLKFH